MKIIEVSCCGECPYLQVGLDNLCEELRYKKIQDTTIIDKDCPLQDVKDEK